jgi:hypothetical protein
MKLKLLILILFSSCLCKAQEYTKGTASQLYWDWRPDIDSNCYEFTYINYRNVNLSDPPFSYKVGIIYWDECDFGKSYIVDTNCAFKNYPLHDTLYRISPYYGEKDTLCGFDTPYNAGTDINFAERTSPVRNKVIYKGLLHLPEKCNKWHFTVAQYFYSNGVRQYYYQNGNAGTGSEYNKKSNLDSMVYIMALNSTYDATWLLAMPIGCSFDNSQYKNNSSSRFLTQIPYYFPVGKTVEYNTGNFDPDHDSIVYSIADTIKTSEVWGTSSADFGTGLFCLEDTSGNSVSDVLTHNYFFAALPGATGINPPRFNALNNPFDTDSTFHLVDSTGKVTFNAKSDMQPVLYTKATEYRNGKFLSETFTISQFTLINENREPSYMKIDTASVNNTMFNNEGTMMSCTGLPISFDAYVKLPISGGNLIVRTTADTTLPGNAACTLSGLHTDSVRLHFTWTPPSNARGLYNVFVSAKDTNCSPPYNHYLQVYTWSFYIDSCLAPLQLNDEEMENDLVLYPNPANNKLTISSHDNFSSIKIFSVISNLVYENKVKPTKELEISVHSLSKGIYFIKIDDKYVSKFVVE